MEASIDLLIPLPVVKGKNEGFAMCRTISEPTEDITPKQGYSVHFENYRPTDVTRRYLTDEGIAGMRRT